MPDSSPTVYVVDDDTSVRESLEMLIECAGWRPESFASGREFLARPRSVAPSCLVLDVVLPGLGGCALQTLLADRLEMPIIFISGRGDVPVVVSAMKAGAVDFFTKPLVADILLSAIGRAIDRSRAALLEVDSMRTLNDRYQSLSRREREVMALVVTGRLNKQIGGTLGISEITVKAHRGQMMRKMNADSLPALVQMATRLGTSDDPWRQPTTSMTAAANHRDG
jgi:FixJ family two-component response regulator